MDIRLGSIDEIRETAVQTVTEIGTNAYLKRTPEEKLGWMRAILKSELALESAIRRFGQLVDASSVQPEYHSLRHR